MIQPKCSICGKDLMDNEGYKIERVESREIKILVEPQVYYWAHDPRDLHRDIKVCAHKECFDKVKLVHKDFDKPVEDYNVCKYPTLDEKGIIVLKTPDKFKTDQDELYAKAKVDAEIKIKEKIN